MTKLEIKDLSMRYQRKYILDNLNLEVESGELVVILGESGCGKTSLLKVIAGILEHETGQILVDGNDISHLSPQKRNIGYVPQGQILFPHMKIKDNVTFGLKAKKLSKDLINEKLDWIVKLTEIKDLLERYPYEISGGQKQRVALARSMVSNPKILLLDEPLSSIDASGRESLALTIRRIQKETETTTLYVTHNQEEARLIGDRVAIMYDGKIQQIGKIIDVDRNPLNFLTAKIMGSLNVFPVSFYSINKENDGLVILDTTIGQMRIPLSGSKIKKKITGIKIPPSEVKIITLQKSKNKKQENIVQKGLVKSVIEIGKNLFRIVVEIQGENIEYLKVDTEDKELVKSLKANQNVTLEISLEKVILL
ncbi:MAG: ABC transporter ATP-binding protein [Candidatus Heimdallarchaeum endolithica]|uniref:Molybdate/tungstate import ATP-binding protein WtpC n=1 Tax=Candidatus Heimdallarchaeum endolithica TaxID=2876572 RepID=A0A9Y1FPP3_9ARCH|nr:MAG: ABC transporter ATP-binding protein [Candidatus Heimdallarchaeum endolithica]